MRLFRQALLARLRELSRQEGVTLFTTLLTGFVILLMRYTGQEDFVVGTLIAGRVRPEIEQALGFFANTLALRTDLSGNPTFKQAVARTRDVVIGAHAHEAFPFEKLVEEIKPERGLSNNPLGQRFFQYVEFLETRRNCATWRKSSSDRRPRSAFGCGRHYPFCVREPRTAGPLLFL